MSLNAEERQRTSSELRANLRLSGLSTVDLAVRVSLTAPEVERVLAVEHSCRPEHVWLVRDHLEAAVVERGLSPQPYTVLREQMRVAASAWFPLSNTPSARRAQ